MGAVILIFMIQEIARSPNVQWIGCEELLHVLFYVILKVFSMVASLSSLMYVPIPPFLAQ